MTTNDRENKRDGKNARTHTFAATGRAGVMSLRIDGGGGGGRIN